METYPPSPESGASGPDKQCALGGVALIDELLQRQPAAPYVPPNSTSHTPDYFDRRKKEPLSDEENQALFDAIDRGLYAEHLLEMAEPEEKIEVKGSFYTQDEIAQLVREGRYARELFLDTNIKLIYWAINTYPHRGSWHDKVATCYLFMDKALYSYDPKKAKWATYAVQPLQWGLASTSTKWYRRYKLTPTDRERLQRITAIRTEVEQQGSRSATIEDFAAGLGVEAIEVDLLLRKHGDALADTYAADSTTQSLPEEQPYIPEVADPAATQALDAVVDAGYSQRQVQKILDMIATLCPAEQKAILLTSGLYDGQQRTGAEAAAVAGIGSGTMNKNLARGRKRLAALLRQDSTSRGSE